MKIKDLRGVFFSLLLFMLDISLFVFAFSNNNKMKMIVSILILPVIIGGFFTQLYIRILSDSMLIYHFIGIIFMPVLLEYDDIKEFSLINNYKIIIHTTARQYPIYVFNAAKKLELFKAKWEAYKNATH